MGFRNNIRYDAKRKRYCVRKMYRGRVHTKVLRTRENAEAWLNQLEARLLHLPHRGPVPTLADATHEHEEYLRRKNRGAETIRYNRIKHRALLSGLGDVKLDRIMREDIDDYVQIRSAGPGTVNKEIAVLRQVYAAVGADPMWTWEPLSHQTKERIIYTPEEIVRLWRHLDEDERVPCALCLFAGLRASEAMRCDASWIRRDQRELWIAERKMGDVWKTALTDTLAAILPKKDPIIRCKLKALQGRLSRISGHIGITPPIWGPGIFRHHCATWIIDYSDGEFDDRVAGLVLGHARTNTTARYTHSQAVARKRKALEVVERAFLAAYKFITPDDDSRD